MSKHDQLDQQEDEKTDKGYTNWVTGVVVCDVISLIVLSGIAHWTTDWNTWASVMAVGLVGIASVNGIILQVLIAGKMTVTMERQEREITLQRQTAQDQWKVMERQANISLGQSVSMQKQLKVMERGLAQTRDLIAQNTIIVEASQRQAKAAEQALTQNELALSDSERAYISVRNIRLVKILGPNENPVVRFDITNGGRTPARKVRYFVAFRVTNEEMPETILNRFMPQESKIPWRIEGRPGTLFMNESYTVHSYKARGLKDNPEWAATLPRILSEKVPLYFLCHVAFTDFQNRSRAFQIIAFYDDQTQRFWECKLRELMLVEQPDFISIADSESVDIQEQEKGEEEGQTPN